MNKASKAEHCEQNKQFVFHAVIIKFLLNDFKN